MSIKNLDVLIVGAGPVGATAARTLADKGLNCTVLEKRSHVGGNCFDQADSFGVLLHKYGPHYFRTNDENLVKWLSRFTDFIEGNYVVKSQVGSKLFPFPVNLDTLELVFDRQFDEITAKTFLNEQAVKFNHEPRNSEEFVLSRVGKKMFETFYEGYTLKQWEVPAKKLGPSVCGRIPIRFNRFDKYVDHKFQVMPRNGFTQLFQNMLSHPKIEVHLEFDYLSQRAEFKPKLGTIYTGPIDLYFEKRFGLLPWRSLEFDFRNFNQEFVQPCVQINYPELSVPYTRSVEIKHATGQKIPSTTISYEYPRAHGDPYYPIPNDDNQKLYLKYRELAAQETTANSVHFAGRLAEYTYINTDQAIERGLEIAKTMLGLQNAKG